MQIEVEWSEKAENDLKIIFDNIKELTLSEDIALNVINDIYETGISINFVE